MEEKVFTVTALNERIRDLFELDPMLGGLCVQGELSNYKVYPSGHHYFTLKDAQSSIRCVLFRSNAQRLRFTPESGMSVLAFGRVSVYPRDGAYQLYCTDVRPLGAGDLQVAYEQLKAKLEREGLFDERHKKPIPAFPRRIGVITSAAGAAVHDVIRVCGQRWPAAKILVLPVRVQGAEAAAEIAGALRYADKYQVADLLITGRGGGSMEDLWCFNDEGVARAIYACSIPVISAVGHEPDVTIADFVADLRAATPSNAGELAVPDAQDVRRRLENLQKRAFQAQEKYLASQRRRVEQLASRRVLESPTGFVDQRRLELDFLRERLGGAGARATERARRRYAAACASLDALSPLRVLARGYAVAADARGEILKCAAQAQIGEEIHVRFHDGGLRCRVEERERTQEE